MTNFIYDEHSQPVRVTNRLGYDTLTQYDNFRRVTRVTQPEGNYETYVYDTRHNRIQTTRVAKSGSGLSDIINSATFDTVCNMPLTETDGRGGVTTYGLLANRCLISTMTQPAVDDGTTSSTALVNPVTTYTWNSLGQLLTRVDPTGREVRNAYNGTTNYLQTVTVENGASDIITTFGRNTAGDITSVTDPRSNVHMGTYDSSRRLTRYDQGLGEIYFLEKNYAQAITYFSKVIEIAKKTDELYMLNVFYHDMAKACFAKNDLTRSKIYLDSCFQHKGSNLSNKVMAYELKAELLETQKDYKGALEAIRTKNIIKIAFIDKILQRSPIN